MTKNIINIGLPSKGRLKHDTINVFKKNKLNIYSERGERDLFGRIKKLTNIKAPSSKRYFDGAPHAILTIKIGGEEINTPFFDHGFPPKEIASLINHILLSL